MTDKVKFVLYVLGAALLLNLSWWGINSYRHFEWMNIPDAHGVVHAIPTWRK